ncbi:hypothetical protein GGTG_04218 [Gaeumannomyces tritici R3-111a-1]|uniref:TLDc domain-containing protein n=1 Tax=Gaeumannomyces tritici (strain R3-111a-1) TaxID=644352 RepID=J3NSG6_GAET3|nr:hypothetical protein GGTG_04218 [Gaeumannomyces tritici R3-111a-1]EJT79129.1 hypothetical protein GGTG_04218 [Gaeumannomyces tritici R3-111a-1]
MELSAEEWRLYCQPIPKKFKRWRLSNPAAVLERLSRTTEQFCLSEFNARANLHKNFSSICSPDKTLTEASLISWIAANLPADVDIETVPGLAAAIPLLFRAIQNLSTYPFTPTQSDAPTGVTYDGFLRVIAWVALALDGPNDHPMAHARMFLVPGENLPVFVADGEGDNTLARAFELGDSEGEKPGLNYEMFDRAFAKVAPALFAPVEHLLALFIKEPTQQQNPPPAEALDSRPKDGLLSRRRLAQLRTLLLANACEPTEDLELGFEWVRAAVAGDKTTAALIEALRAEVGDFHQGLLLIQGQAANMEKPYIFGFYSCCLPTDEHGIQHPNPTGNDLVPAHLFQLGPVQDGFPGVPGRPAWVTEGEVGDEAVTLRFGDPRAGASLCLDLAAGRATFRHNVFPAADGSSVRPEHAVVYQSPVWRGSWEVEMEVENVELWLTDLL